jgi:hypothetical protein
MSVWKLGFFCWKNQPYYSGTTLVYKGKCFLEDKEIILNNEIVTFLYSKQYAYFKDSNGVIYTCPSWNFTYGIVYIINDPNKPKPIEKEPEFYWTDEMVTKTLWYIIIMLVATIFKDAIFIWIFATIIWYNSVFKNK